MKLELNRWKTRFVVLSQNHAVKIAIVNIKWLISDILDIVTSKKSFKRYIEYWRKVPVDNQSLNTPKTRLLAWISANTVENKSILSESSIVIPTKLSVLWIINLQSRWTPLEEIFTNMDKNEISHFIRFEIEKIDEDLFRENSHTWWNLDNYWFFDWEIRLLDYWSVRIKEYIEKNPESIDRLKLWLLKIRDELFRVNSQTS